MIVGFICTKVGSPKKIVRLPKPTISAVENHSIGDTLPSRHFDTASAATAATMKASVPEMIAATSPKALGSAGDCHLYTPRNTSSGP